MSYKLSLKHSTLSSNCSDIVCQKLAFSKIDVVTESKKEISRNYLYTKL